MYPLSLLVTPQAGDRSLADVVIHEISHSWTGNLVTNRQWGHSWLNEGFTMFVQRKIEGRLRGEATRHFSALGGWKDLADCVSLWRVIFYWLCERVITIYLFLMMMIV